MNDWKLIIDIQSLWEEAKEGKIEDVNVFTNLLYKKLSDYSSKIHSISYQVVKEFDELMYFLKETSFVDYDDFDDWMSDFYDWADTHRIWIKTNF